MKQSKENYKYTEVWGDTVDLKELLLSCLIGVILTMTMYFVGRSIFATMDGLDEGMANGYSLLVGIGGCILSGVVNTLLFKPKRNFEGILRADSLEEVLKDAGITVEEEIEALAKADIEIIEELEDLQMYSLLALIPETSKNYKPEYRVKAKESDQRSKS